MLFVFSEAFLFDNSIYIFLISFYGCILRFLTGGGAITLANWLTKAAVEEQTSVLLLILKVNLDHPVNMLCLRYLNLYVAKYHY